MSDVKSFSFDFNVAKKRLSNDAIVDYLRNTAHTNINWNFFNNQDNNQIVDSLSANSDGIEIYDVGQEALREDMQERAKNLYAQKDTQGEKILNFFGDMFHTQDSKARKRQEEDLERNLKYLDINALDAKGANTLANALSLQTLDKDTGKLLSAKDSLTQRKNALLQKDEILNTQNYHDLSAEQKKVVDDEVGAVENFFRDYVPFVDNREKNFKEWQQVERNREFVNSELLPKIEALKSETFRIADLLSNDTEKRAKAQGFLDDVAKIAQEFGFDDAGYDKDSNLYIGKDGEFYRANENFFDNFLNIISATKFELGGSIAGGIYGLKAGKNAGKLGALGGAIAGAALGAMGGSVADSIVNHYLLDKDAGAKDIIHKSLEAGALSVVGDIALLGLSKIPLKSTIHKATNATNWVVNSNVFTGTAKNYLKGQNIKAAQDLLNASVNAEQQAAIKAFAKEFGGDIKKFDKQRVTPQIEQAFGADSVITKTAQKLDDLLIRNDKGNAQRELLEIIRSDDSSLSLGLLLEVAQESPTANKALRDLLKATTINLEKQLETLNISPQTAFTIFRDLQVGTKESYNQAINEVLNELYQDKRTILNRAPYDKLRADLEQNVLLGQNELNFLKFVENNIFNPQGVTFSQLNNAKKILNSFYKDVQGGTKDYLKNVVEKDLKQQIDNAIFEIFKTEPKLYGEAKNLYENALSDYATMANTIKTLKKIGFDKSTKTQEEALNALIKYAKGGGGIAEIPNYAELTKGLSEANKQSLELSALQQIFTESLIGDESFKVFDSKAFFKKLGNLENVFNTQGAKEYIGFLRGFDKLFHNDAEIALRLGFASPKQEGSSIATSLQGAMQQKFIKGVFATLIRNLPHNSIIIKGLGFSEKVQGAALRYHLRRALEKSQDINDFKYHFSQKATHYPFNNATKEIINKITNDVLEAINNETRDLLDKTKPLRMAKQEELTDEILREAQTLNAKLWIDNLESKELIESLGMNSTQPAKIIMQGDTITHILARHGAQSPLVQKSGQKAVSNEDLITHSNIIKNADIQGVATNKDGQKVLISGKQINGYCVVVESISTKQNELKLKTMYFENGNLRDNEAIKSIERLLSETPRNPLVQRPNNHLDNTHLTMQGNIIPHSKPFASTKANFTKEQWQNLTTQEKIQAFREQRAREKAQIAEAQAQEQAKRIAAHQEKRNAIQAQKDSNAGKAINEVDLNLGDSIEYTHLKPTRINLENKDYPAEFVIINKEDLKPNFNTTGTQGRTQKQDNVIQDIQENLNPNKLFFSEGGFDGLPIVLQDGSIAVGNHRAQALKNLSKESLEAYKKSAKEVFNVDLKDNELIVRMLDKDTPKQEILNLSFASNTGREQNLSEKALSTIGKYQDALKRLPSNIEAQSVEEMQSIVSRTLDPTNNGLNIFDTNLALLTSLAKSKDKNILEALNSISGDAEQKARITKMFVDNAGSFHNIAKQTQMPNLDLRNYLNQIIYFTANAKESRAQNFQELIAAIESLLKTTDAKGSNALLEQNPTYYDDLIGKIVGYSFARFKELENPSRAMFEFLNNIQDTLRQELEPTLFKEGRPLSSADIYDFASVSIKSGIPSDETSKLLDLLPQLKQKQEAFGAKNEPLGNSEKLKSVSKQNLHTENAVVKENLTTQNPQDYTTLQKQLFGNSEQLKNTSNMDTENAVVKENLTTSKESLENLTDIPFRDNKGKEHILSKEIQEQWLNTFNLKSLDEAYIPQLPKEAKEALGGKEIRLQKGSLLKLVSQGREEFIPQIKQVLDEPEAILKDIDEGFLFIKHLKDNDYFVNVSYDKGEYLVSVSNGIKEVNNLENKLKAGAKILYQSPSFSSSRNKLLQTSQYSTNKIDSDIIPQNNTKLQSNVHIGNGLASGSVAGFETDEQGNLSFNPTNFLLGLAGGAAGSKAIAKGFKAISKNPELKAKVTKELADTLSKGWDSAVKQYPILESLQPRYIVKNEKGRDLQAQGILREVEITPIHNALESLESTPTPKKLTEAQIQKLLKEFDNLENLQEHLSTRADNRQEIYNLLLDTKEKPQIQYKKDSKDKYLKKYKSTGKEPYFYLLVTQDKDKTFITHFKTRDAKYLSKEIADSDEIVKGADIIEELSQRTGDNQSSASTNIIPQIQAKFKFDEKKAKDLAQWHKESHPITKDKQGLPKVFYHGTGDDYGFEIFKPNAIDGTPAIYFTTSKKVATSYAQMGYTKEGIYKTFLNIKNPLVVDFRGKSYDGLEYEKLLKKALKNGNDGVIIKNVFDDTGGYYDKQGNFKEIGKADTFIVFNPNQIKAVENKGLKGESGEHKYFNAESPNIYQSNAHIGSGLASGSVAGFETDEQGNLSFNPTNFLLGLAGGAVGSKAISKAVAKATELRLNKLSKAYPKIATHNPELFKEVFKKDIAFLARKGSYNALTSFFNKYKMLDLNPQFFAGEKALLSGEFKPQAQRLQRAKDMLKAGKSDDEIWEKTGWFKGLDDKWRFEINPDFQVSYIKTKLKQGKVLHMRDILQGENKALLKAYPELLEYEIIGSYSKDFLGVISSKDKIIAISTQLNKFQTNATLAHEIQHAIQELEGFAKGSNLNEANQIFQDYYRAAGEVEARAVEKRALDLAFKREELEAKESTQSLKSLAEQGNPQAKEILELYDKKNAIFNEFKKAHNALQELKQKGYDDSTKEMQEANQKLNKLKETFTEHLNLIPERINGKPYDIDSTAYELKKDADLILKEYNQIKNTNPQKSYDTPKENVIISKHNIEGNGYEHYKLNPQQKEAKGLYNVAYNGKNATRVLKDLEAVDEAIRFSQGNKNKGAKHIKIKHSTNETQEGYVKPIEVANLGKDLRAFLKNYEPYVENNRANIYEWENKEGIRFRLVVNEVKGEADSNPAQLPKPFNEEIITFYSDRNLKERMQFKNPKVQEAYEKEINKELIPQIQAKFNFDEKKAKDLAEIPQTKLQSNHHLGAGLASGSVAGFETDEQGNLSFNPTNFLLGLAGGALGSKAIAKGFKAISKNPEFKEKVTKELADTLSKGWDSAVKQYPILESLQPRYIVKNEKGRIAQSKAILKEVETKAGKLEKAFLLENRLNTDALEKEAIELPKELEWRDFKKQLEAKGMKVAIDTPIGKVNINVYKAYAHFTNNTYKKDRRKFSGAFLDTLTNPLFVVKQKYRPEVSQVAKKANAMRSNNALVSKIQNKTRLQTGNDEIIQDSYVFYKPFKDDKGLVHLASFAIAQNGELLHKTFYDIKNLSKLQRILKSKDENVIYFKGEQ